MLYKDIVFPRGSLFLVTGGAGFIGSNLCEAVLNLGYRVRCLDNLSTGNRSNADLFSNNKIKYSVADITKARRILRFNPEYDFIRGCRETLEWYKGNL